jgi:hypothetical protein
MDNSFTIAGIMNANNTLFNMLIRVLHDQGVLDKAKVREGLLGLVRECQQPQGVPRYDVLQFENLALLLADDAPVVRAGSRL